MSRRRSSRSGRVILRNRVIRFIGASAAAQMVSQEKARWVHPDLNGNYDIELMDSHELAARRSILADVKRSEARSVLVSDPDARRSCVVLSKREVEACVGLHGQSRTGHLTQDAREARVKLGFVDMDLVESAKRKFHAMFPERLGEPSFE